MPRSVLTTEEADKKVEQAKRAVDVALSKMSFILDQVQAQAEEVKEELRGQRSS
jgi:hypothetical protein